MHHSEHSSPNTNLIPNPDFSTVPESSQNIVCVPGAVFITPPTMERP